MERTRTVALHRHVGERVRLAGWLHRLRQLSNVSFLVLRDAWGVAQMVIEDEAMLDTLAAVHAESVLLVEGTVVAMAQAPGGVELRADRVEVLVPSSEPPPLDLFRPALKAPLPTILDHAPLALRHPRQRAIFRLAAASTQGFRATLRAQDFVEIHTPKIVAAATEGGAKSLRSTTSGARRTWPRARSSTSRSW